MVSFCEKIKYSTLNLSLLTYLLFHLRLVNGKWSSWSVWSGCSVSCGTGQRKRLRFCLNPVPANGALNCTGPLEEKHVCNLIDCPGICIICFNLNFGNVRISYR